MVSIYAERKEYMIEVTRKMFEEINQEYFDRIISIVKGVLKDANMQPEDINDVICVGGSACIPLLLARLKTLFKVDIAVAIRPEEAVCEGASLQGAILGGLKNDLTDVVMLLDVCPLSLGLELGGNHMSVLIPRNTPVPCTVTQQYTTTVDNQSSLQIRVLQGERIMAADNIFLGEVAVKNIERRRKGVPRIEVTFKLDESSMLSTDVFIRVCWLLLTTLECGTTSLNIYHSEHYRHG